MSVGERRIDLYGSRVALQGSIQVLHLFKQISHVAVGVRKTGRNPKTKMNKKPPRFDIFFQPDSVSVVRQGIVKLPLLLKNARQIGMRRSKIRKNLDKKNTNLFIGYIIVISALRRPPALWRRAASLPLFGLARVLRLPNC